MLRIQQVNTTDIGGGAEKCAWELMHEFQNRGYVAWLTVGCKVSDDPCVFATPKYDDLQTRQLIHLYNRLAKLESRVRGPSMLSSWLRITARKVRSIKKRLGHEDFSFPGTYDILALVPEEPDIVHCHNLHGRYFDLRLLPWLCPRVPVILTLHDAWLLAGRCIHAFTCEGWLTGCGHCPDLKNPPPATRDATAYNWSRKQSIYRESRIYVATPSRWLMQKVERSMLKAAIAEARVIPNGVNLSVFHPQDKLDARAALGVPRRARVLLFSANGIRQNLYKDFQTLRNSLSLIAEHFRDQEIVLLALGEDAPRERIGKAEIRFVPYQQDPKIVARHHNAADIYVHATRADTFPNSVIEALACGTPVVATELGGIPEQVDEGVSGFLVPPSNGTTMALAISKILEDDALRAQMGQQAAEIARQRFDLNRQVDDYLLWYEAIIERHVEQKKRNANDV
jgi:glycosyltransferase involved in cell wall biosynthesis